MDSTKREKEKNKLSILYLLMEFDISLTDTQLIAICTDLGLMDYFDLNNYLCELSQNGLISREEAVNGVFFSVTEIGRTTFDFFKKSLPLSERTAMAEYARLHRDEFRNRSRIFSEYMQVSDHQFRVMLKIFENSLPIFEISFFAHTKQEAQQYVDTWRQKAMEIYAKTFEALHNPN